MIKRLFNFFRVTLYLKGESRSNEELDGTSVSLVDSSSQQKNVVVRVVHAGGLVELYHDAISAVQVMENNPGMCLSRPQIFKRPHESILQPDEKLLPGQKYYLVPRSTVRKLKHKYAQKSKEASVCKGMEVKKSVDEEEDSFEDSFCSAKDFFICREKWFRYSMIHSGRDVDKPFAPPIKKPRMWKVLGWQPSLTSVEEVSP
ncbi:hypothetical protein IFM89_032020 [Coptis chinensis]|uniref:Uncharacterized protein n=1 Tax=Coptis chinensis TaxID=261450 RepID=A0A835LF73_9MAGN|nr:hypothetical protein IFM89_032020 [Coptis chinensis]